MLSAALGGALAALLTSSQPRLVGLGDAAPTAFAVSGDQLAVGSEDGRVFVSRDLGLTWRERVLCDAPAPSAARASRTPRARYDLSTPFGRLADAGFLSGDLRGLWRFEDGATDLDLFPENLDGPELDVPESPPRLPDAGETTFEVPSGALPGSGGAAKRLAAAVAAEREAEARACRVSRMAWLGADVVAQVGDRCVVLAASGALSPCPAGALEHATGAAPPDARGLTAGGVTLRDGAVWVPGPRPHAPAGPSLEATLAAAEARFGHARRLRREAPARALAAAFVPTVVLGGGYAAFEAGADLDAGFLQGGTRDVSLPGVVLGPAGTSSSDAARIFAKTSGTDYAWGAVLLVWPWGGPAAPTEPPDDEEALQGEVTRLYRERARLANDHGATPEAQLRRLEVLATLDWLTGGLFAAEVSALSGTPDPHDGPRAAWADGATQ